jgi:hypothetical protein
MTHKPVRPPDAASGLSTEAAQRIVRDAGRRYFESRRSRVDAFVDHHFSLAGSAAIHRKAVGWDMLKAPANIALGVPQLATKLAAAGAKAVGAERASAFLGSRNLMFDTAVGEEIEWLIITDLLELPFRQGERESRRDALTEAILSAPELKQTLNDTLAALAQQAAVASFPLGAGVVSLWYGIFPAATSPLLVGGVTGGLLAVSSIAAAFAGILADPVQRKLGLHQRRLHRLIDALERQWNAEREEAGFVGRDPYVARLLDLFDLLGSAYRLART